MTEITNRHPPVIDRGDHHLVAADAAPADDDPIVVPLNQAAAVYDALAREIRGTAAGWSDHALAKLEQGLLRRYGPIIGGRHPVRRLVRLAAQVDLPVSTGRSGSAPHSDHEPV